MGPLELVAFHGRKGFRFLDTAGGDPLDQRDQRFVLGRDGLA